MALTKKTSYAFKSKAAYSRQFHGNDIHEVIEELQSYADSLREDILRAKIAENAALDKVRACNEDMEEYKVRLEVVTGEIEELKKKVSV